MKETQLSFQRYEKKYMMTAGQYEALWAELSPRLRPDEYFSSTVCSLYYDTDDYSLIRHSIQKPVYKEKLRLRSYGIPNDDSPVFVELKKKFKGIVYKRRIELEKAQAESWLDGGPAPDDSQISREIDWVLNRYELSPKIIICCDREAWVDKENSELRFTFDKNIRYREDQLDLSFGSQGRLLLEDGSVLMEIKMPETSPLWLAELLSRHKVFPAGLSKYGKSYEQKLMEEYYSGVMEIV
ncbi:MAG: polyphosphate polymerase domain-containing protein [Oscillospiraceae bacterium]|nr:polyphosphate polymerase domain-containing protein [Oscillospiraceae bacterium]